MAERKNVTNQTKIDGFVVDLEVFLLFAPDPIGTHRRKTIPMWRNANATLHSKTFTAIFTFSRRYSNARLQFNKPENNSQKNFAATDDGHVRSL